MLFSKKDGLQKNLEEKERGKLTDMEALVAVCYRVRIDGLYSWHWLSCQFSYECDLVALLFTHTTPWYNEIEKNTVLWFI